MEAPASPGGGNMMVCCGKVLELGGFDESLDRAGTCLLSNGETDVAVRVRERGWQVIWVPGATIHHWASSTKVRKEWLRERMLWQGISDGLLARKRARYLWLCMRRLAALVLRTPLEMAATIHRPEEAWFTAELELLKTMGVFKILKGNGH